MSKCKGKGQERSAPQELVHPEEDTIYLLYLSLRLDCFFFVFVFFSNNTFDDDPKKEGKPQRESVGVAAAEADVPGITGIVPDGGDILRRAKQTNTIGPVFF